MRAKVACAWRAPCVRVGPASRRAVSARKIQANEGKGQRDRLRLGVCVLRREGIDDVLVNERRIAMRQRVAAQLVVGVLF